ncbi:hypothetical protein AB0C14_02950 [Microbispora hainanensis]|uniref:hypothetical protein n=1 Tax=Microbispora hainanensis TaxID=568844 RepID=UPI0034062852
MAGACLAAFVSASRVVRSRQTVIAGGRDRGVPRTRHDHRGAVVQLIANLRRH